MNWKYTTGAVMTRNGQSCICKTTRGSRNLFHFKWIWRSKTLKMKQINKNIASTYQNTFAFFLSNPWNQEGMDMLGWSSQHPPPHWLIFCNYGTTWVWIIINVRPRITSFPVICWKLRCVLCVRMANCAKWITQKTFHQKIVFNLE